MLELRTSRLHLVAATLAIASAEPHDPAGLAAMLDARLPARWPPPLNDDASARWIADHLAAHPAAVGWSMWYFILDDGTERVIIGNGGFKGEPENGVVEIGYSVVPEFQQRGYASEAVGALIVWAFGRGVERIFAETLPENSASRALLRKLGFRPTDGASNASLLRFEKSKP